MFKITLAHSPSFSHIHHKYYPAIEQIIRWCQEIQRAFTCQLYGIYVRGSVAHGAQNVHSDMDMVVLLKTTLLPLSTLLQFENTIDALSDLYVYSFSIDVKVYMTNDDASVEPATEVSGSLRQRIKRHLNFDLCANGVCVWGEKIRDYLAEFSSPLDFVKNNQIIWGIEISHLGQSMQNDPTFNAYYPLIKKCIKLAAILHFKPEVGYLSCIRPCFDYVLKNNLTIRSDMALLFDHLEKDVSKIPFDALKKLKSAIMRIMNAII